MAKKKELPYEYNVSTTSAPADVALTLAEEFYVENNLDKTDVELSKDLMKPVPLVREHIHKTQGQSRINKLLVREKGCVVMTEGASMAADESRKGYVTENAIQRAVSKGDYEEAARLQNIFKQQQKQDYEEIVGRTQDHIHRLNKR